MRKTKQQIAAILMWVVIVSISIAHGQTPTSRNTAESTEVQLTNLLAEARPQKRAGFSLMPSSRATNVSRPSFSITMAAGPNLTVMGSGTVMGGGTLGRLTKWTGFTSSNSFIGDSIIFESKTGLVGIGTDTPTSKLTVPGTIETTSGGVKFPDGTVQTSSAAGALFSVAHDTTLTGNGTQASPLGVASPLEVRDLDNPARQPVQANSVRTADGSTCGLTLFFVPTGKRLVIEYASMSARFFNELGAGEVVFFEIQTAALGHTTSHRSSMSQPSVVAEQGLQRSIASVGQQLRIYADPGSGVFFTGFRSNTGNVTFDFAISGYLVDIP